MNKFFERFNFRLHKIPVFKNAYYWLIVPLTVLFIALICGTVYSFTDGGSFANIGVDFAGGTVLTVEVQGANIQGDDYEKNVELIQQVTDQFGITTVNEQKSGSNAIVCRYQNRINGVDYNAKDKSEEMIAINNEVCDAIQKAFTNKYPSIKKVSANAEMINATASSELIRKAALSVGIALLLMVIYVIIRFDFYSGVATLASQLHDVMILLCGVIIFRIQINSTLIAAVITVVAYSINNTIVVLDRIREKVKPYKTKKEKYDPGLIVDDAVSDSITRSLFTALTTLFTITILACVGVQSLTEFALPIIFGILAGLYSSIFVAPALWGVMMQAKLGLNKNKSRAKSRAKR